MATIKNNGQEVILLCNMGYDYNGKKIKPVAKSVIVPDDVIPAVWLSKQAEIFENEVKARQAQPMPLALFLINHKEEQGKGQASATKTPSALVKGWGCGM